MNQIISKPVGLHIMGEITTKEGITSLIDAKGVKENILILIKEVNFTPIGLIEHTFTEGGYSLVIALAESHLSIHTWPEFNYVAFDLFVCNYSKDNTEHTRKLFNEIAKLFDPLHLVQRELIR